MQFFSGKRIAQRPIDGHTARTSPGFNLHLASCSRTGSLVALARAVGGGCVSSGGRQPSTVLAIVFFFFFFACLFDCAIGLWVWSVVALTASSDQVPGHLDLKEWIGKANLRVTAPHGRGPLTAAVRQVDHVLNPIKRKLIR